MNFTIKLNGIRTLDKIEDYWKKEDYIKLLELFDYSDPAGIADAELFDMLSMAISDFEPDEAAKIVLSYKLDGTLREGQIENLSHELLEDRVAEEYPDIALHYPLFNINQLLYEAYNGKFPKMLASSLEIELSFAADLEVTKEIVLRTISDLLSEKSLLKRLFDDQLDSEQELKDADGIIWELWPVGENVYRVLSSDYWLNKEDFALKEYSGALREEEITHGK